MTEIILSLIALVSAPVSAIITSRLQRAKYRTEVEQLKSDVRSRQIDNDRKAIEMIMELVVEPLRKDMLGLQNKLDILTHAIEQIHKCPYADNCPVSAELQRTSQSGEANEGGGERGDNGGKRRGTASPASGEEGNRGGN